MCWEECRRTVCNLLCMSCQLVLLSGLTSACIVTWWTSLSSYRSSPNAHSASSLHPADLVVWHPLATTVTVTPSRI